MSQKGNSALGRYAGRYGRFAMHNCLYSWDDLSQMYFILGRFVMKFREVTFGMHAC